MKGKNVVAEGAGDSALMEVVVRVGRNEFVAEGTRQEVVNSLYEELTEYLSSIAENESELEAARILLVCGLEKELRKLDDELANKLNLWLWSYILIYEDEDTYIDALEKMECKSYERAKVTIEEYEYILNEFSEDEFIENIYDIIEKLYDEFAETVNDEDYHGPEGELAVAWVELNSPLVVFSKNTGRIFPVTEISVIASDWGNIREFSVRLGDEIAHIATIDELRTVAETLIKLLIKRYAIIDYENELIIVTQKEFKEKLTEGVECE
ncbi:hypothetical protein [Thermococcus sp. GR6]|uniref:hypothetical protein n=1 Tax=Thermococcus sp. GR6 TaxID=1638256 RepID=UPI0014310AD6|nr:hypothetical protein [Thermococcus sp. GR6]NJE41851.1 hypothetical protein [Thermococcus sp. GR6]